MKRNGIRLILEQNVFLPLGITKRFDGVCAEYSVNVGSKVPLSKQSLYLP